MSAGEDARRREARSATPGLSGGRAERWDAAGLCDVAIWLVALWPLVRLARDWARGLDHLIYRYLVDDAFYYFEISRHIPEFNEGVANSGFHPLYAFLVAPLHSLGTPEVAIPASLLVLVLAQAAGAIVLYRLLSKLWSRPVAFLCGATWAVSGSLYSLAMTGVETVLAALLVMLFLSLFVDGVAAGEPRLRWRGALPGLVAAAAFLARLDSPILMAPAGAVLAYRLVRSRRFGELTIMTATALAPSLAWLAYIRLRTGDVFPTSGAAIRALRGVEETTLLPPELTAFLAEHLTRRFGHFFWRGDTGVWVVVALTVLAVIGALVKRSGQGRARRRRSRTLTLFVVCVLTGAAGWSAYYLLFQGTLRYWYVAHLGLLAYGVLLPPVVDLLGRLVRRPAALLAAGAVLVVAIGALSSPRAPRGPQLHDKYRSALAADEIWRREAPEGRLGAFNAGLYDYFMETDVINLDGLVNPESLAAIRDDDLPGYLRRKDIRFLIEHEVRTAANLHRLYDDPRVRLTRWVDLSEAYEPFAGRHARRTFLWRVEVLEAAPGPPRPADRPDTGAGLER